ncbi:MAG: hypothetical protein KBT00_06005 [Bacteroidales bacterium]|nr:hypothetical protein [Candidatus Cacconaster merdequi]
MANIADIISQAVSASAGKIDIPSNVKNQVLGGLSDSIFGSLTQTAAKPGGIDMVKSLLTGKTAAASSPITALAGNLFTNNVVKKLGLGGGIASALSGIVPSIMGKLSGVLKDQDGDGDVDFQDILIALKGGGAKQSGTSSILGAATGILGGLLKKK